MNSKNKFAKLGLIFILCTIGFNFIVGALNVVFWLLSFIPIINILTGILSTLLSVVGLIGAPVLFVLSIVFSIIGLKSEKKKLSVIALIIAGAWAGLIVIGLIVAIVLAILAVTGVIGLSIFSSLFEGLGLFLLV